MTNIRLLAVVPLVLLGCSIPPTVAVTYSCNLKFKLSDRSTPISRFIIYGSQVGLKLGKDNSYAISSDGALTQKLHGGILLRT